MHEEPKPGESTAPARPVRSKTSGAGLVEHGSRDPFPTWASGLVGLLALAIAIGVGGAIWLLNPSLQTGEAAGTPNQVGELAAPGGAPAGLSPEAEEGLALLADSACTGCHVIPGVPGATGQVGPSLEGIASRTTIAGGAVTVEGPEDLQQWIMNPQELKPGTAMPDVGLTEEQAARIVAYLETLE